MGGKSSTSTSQVQIPASVLAQYNSVVAGANKTAQTPFSTYSGQFVAPVNEEQSSGISATNAAANEAQPYYGAATAGLGAAQAGTAPVNAAAEYGTASSAAPLTGSEINSYLSPYLGDVLNSTEKLQNQSNQQQQAGQLGDAITSGAFGGDRTGIAAANLEEQQNLANSNVIAGIANQGYDTALGTATTEQNIGLAGAQQLAGIGSTAYGEGANTASELGALGTGAQTAGLSGAAAQIGAGTVEQQTQQAQDTALYDQFLQQQSYPFQVGQWLAGISEGTGSLQGSTTTTTQPGGFFSDKRLKHSIKKIGRTFDGQHVYSYKMADDQRTHIGLIAQEVEKKHPDAVGLAAGFKTVDYGEATKDASKRGHFAAGGVPIATGKMPVAHQGAPVVPHPAAATPVHQATGKLSGQAGATGAIPDEVKRAIGIFARGGAANEDRYATGGVVPMRRVRYADGGLAGVLEAQQAMYGQVGGGAHGPAGTSTRVPAPMGGAPQLAVAHPSGVAPQTGMQNVNSAVDLGKNAAGLYGDYQKLSAAHDAAQTAAAQKSVNSYMAANPPQLTLPQAPMPSDQSLGLGAGGGDGGGGGGDASMADGAGLRRGGVAAGRGHFDAGGTPYTPDEQAYQLNIPDDSNRTPLAVAQTPQGQGQSGLGDASSIIKDVGTVASIAAMFMNRGGVAGGRRGYDDGGAPSDPIVVPDDSTYPTVEAPDASNAGPPPAVAPASSGVAAAPAPSQKAAAPSDDKPWYKDAHNLIPLLSAISAMGTAKTVHPGVALAAGLGAGANSYVDTQQALAKAAETQAVTQGLQNQNVVSGVKARAAQDFYPPGGVAAGSQPAAPAGAPAPTAAIALQTPAASSGPTDADKQASKNIDDAYRSKYFVNPAYTPQEMAKWKNGNAQASLLGIDGPVKEAEKDHDQRVLSQQVLSKNAAQHEADTLYAQATDPNADFATSQAAIVKYNAVHQWTGDEYNTVGGNKNNSRNGAPAIGIAAAQLTPEQLVDARSRAMQLVDVPNSDGTITQKPAWQAHHAPNADAYTQQLTGFAPLGAQATGAASAPPAPAPAASAPPARTARPRAQTPAAAPTASAAPAQSAPQTGDPYLSKALTDPTYRIPAPVVKSGTTQAPADLVNINAINAKKRELQDESGAATEAAGQSLQYLKAAKSIVDSKGATVGIYGGTLAKASQLVGGTPQSTNYQELAKYLMNAAVQAAKGNFNNATQQEMGMQVGEMSPNKDMDEATINKLVRTGIKGANYIIGTAKRANAFVDAGMNPLRFKDWNQQYYPRDKIVNAEQTATGPDGTRLYKINGKWVQ